MCSERGWYSYIGVMVSALYKTTATLAQKHEFLMKLHTTEICMDAGSPPTILLGRLFVPGRTHIINPCFYGRPSHAAMVLYMPLPWSIPWIRRVHVMRAHGDQAAPTARLRGGSLVT